MNIILTFFQKILFSLILEISLKVFDYVMVLHGRFLQLYSSIQRELFRTLRIYQKICLFPLFQKTFYALINLILHLLELFPPLLSQGIT